MVSAGGPLQAPVASAAEAAMSCRNRRRSGENVSGCTWGEAEVKSCMVHSAMTRRAIRHPSRVQDRVVSEQSTLLVSRSGDLCLHIKHPIGLYQMRAGGPVTG